jgi:hypothetical protein
MFANIRAQQTRIGLPFTHIHESTPLTCILSVAFISKAPFSTESPPKHDEHKILHHQANPAPRTPTRSGCHYRIEVLLAENTAEIRVLFHQGDQRLTQNLIGHPPFAIFRIHHQPVENILN